MKIAKIDQILYLLLQNVRKKGHFYTCLHKVFIKSLYLILLYTFILSQPLESTSFPAHINTKRQSLVAKEMFNESRPSHQTSLQDNTSIEYFKSGIFSSKGDIREKNTSKKESSNYRLNLNSAISSLYKDEASPIVQAKSKAQLNSLKLGIHTIITYTIGIRVLNNNDSDMRLRLVNQLPKGTTFIAGSFYVDEVQRDVNLSDGILEVYLDMEDYVSVSFQVSISEFNLPAIFINSAAITAIKVNGYRDSIDHISTARTITTTIANSHIQSQFEADKDIVDLNDIVTYTLTLTNDGNIDIKSLALKDVLPIGIVLPAGMLFIPNSLRVDDNIISFSDIEEVGLLLGNLGAGESIRVTFQAQVIQMFPVFTNFYRFSYFCDLEDLKFPSKTDTVTIHSTDAQANSLKITSFTGKIKSYKFLNKTKYLLKMSWKSSSAKKIAVYHIYYKKRRIAKVAAHHRPIYETSVLSVDDARHYSIMAYGKNGNKGAMANIKIK